MVTLLLLRLNPATSYVNITTKSAIKQIQLFSTKGQIVKSVVTSGYNYSLPVSDLAAGEYILRLTTATETINKTIVKE